MRALVLRGSLGVVSIGSLVGLVVSLGLSGLLRGMLFEVGPADPLTLVSVVAVLTAAAWLAVAIPVRRSMRVDPMIAMRSE